MAVTADIAATYRGPGRVVRRILAMGQREDRALVFVMGACALMFLAQFPRLAREAHLTGQELNMLLGASLLAWLMIAPLALYAIAALSHLLAKLFGGRGTWFGARIALFWAFLASTPILLMHGLVAGFAGPGAALQGIGLIWMAVFLWFWFAGLRRAEAKEA